MLILLAGNHHTPYLYNLCRALPEHAFHVRESTPHAPTGWRSDQRPPPANLSLPTRIGFGLVGASTVLTQTAHDIAQVSGQSPRRLVHQSHNRAEMEGADADAITGLLAARSGPGQRARTTFVSISEHKAETWRGPLAQAGYHGPLAVIPPGLDADDFLPWEGDGGYVLTVANGLARPLFDGAAWAEITRGLPARLVGEYNELFGHAAIGPARSWDELKEHYRHARCYLSVNRWPYEDGYNLALLEAMAAGCPVLALTNETLPEVVAGCTVEESRAYMELALNADPRDALLRVTSEMNRQYVRQHHSLAAFRRRWLSVLAELCGGFAQMSSNPAAAGMNVVMTHKG